MPRLFLFILLALLPLSARGSIGSPDSSVTVSADGRMVFVVVSPMPQYDREPTATLPDGRVVDVHQTFAKSGVYDASTLTPVWQVDWFAFRHDLVVSDDLRHVVWRNRRGLHEGWALAFYEEGRLVRRYNCGQLLTRLRGDWCLPFTAGDWHTQWYGEDFDLSADRSHVLLSTVRRRTYLWGHTIDLGFQEFYAFDLATGSVVSRRSAGGWRVWAYAGVPLALLVVSALACRILWRKLKGLAQRRRRGFPVLCPAGVVDGAGASLGGGRERNAGVETGVE